MQKKQAYGESWGFRQSEPEHLSFLYKTTPLC